LSAEGLARTVTTGAAQLLRLQASGRLAAGVPADLTIVRPLAACPFDALVSATRADVRLTMIDGKPCVAEPPLAGAFEAAGVAAMAARVDGAPRMVARWIGRHVSQMQLQEPGFEVLH
jgi:cytosine/adenosine deaminase-related metal-dependent hydrolase